MAIHTAYYNDIQIGQIFPVPAGYPSIAAALGNIDNNNYVGKVADAPDLRTNVKGVFDMWGQATFPVCYYNNGSCGNLQDFWATNPNMPPMIAFHGKNDLTLRPGITPIFYAPPQTVNGINYTPYNSESLCTTTGLTPPYTLDQNNASADIYGAGSKGIYDIFHAMTSHPHIELYIDCEMAHCLDDACNQCGEGISIDKISGKCVPCFQSDFGTSFTNSIDVQKYMVQRVLLTMMLFSILKDTMKTAVMTSLSVMAE